jgi:hypothetical protein
MLLALRNILRDDEVTYGHVCDCVRVIAGQSSVVAAAGGSSFSWSRWLVGEKFPKAPAGGERALALALISIIAAGAGQAKGVEGAACTK